VALPGQLEGAADGGRVGPGVALADPLQQRGHVGLGRRPGVVRPGVVRPRDGPDAVLGGRARTGLGLAVRP
jgi:hypothetical protein